MTEQEAKNLTDLIIEKVLTHQVNVVGESMLRAEEPAKATAKGIAAFRQTLIEELKKQPM